MRSFTPGQRSQQRTNLQQPLGHLASPGHPHAVALNLLHVVGVAQRRVLDAAHDFNALAECLGVVRRVGVACCAGPRPLRGHRGRSFRLLVRIAEEVHRGGSGRRVASAYGRLRAGFAAEQIRE